MHTATQPLATAAPPPSLARAEPVAPLYDPAELNGLVPADPRQPLPIRKVLARILDGGFRGPPEVVRSAGCVAVGLREIGDHFVHDAGINACCGVVVHIDGKIHTASNIPAAS